MLGDSTRNDSDSEAKSAILRAHELMAKYDISMEEIDDQEKEDIYSHEMCEHKWDYGFRIPLAKVLAKSFRCMVYLNGKRVVFMGHSTDAKICKDTFEFAYAFIVRRANAVYNKRYSMGQETKGVFNSYAHGFITGIKDALEIQCRALIVVTPEDVVEEFNNMSQGWVTKKRKGISGEDIDPTVWRQGRVDGKQFMDKDKLPQNS